MLHPTTCLVVVVAGLGFLDDDDGMPEQISKTKKTSAVHPILYYRDW